MGIVEKVFHGKVLIVAGCLICLVIGGGTFYYFNYLVAPLPTLSGNHSGKVKIITKPQYIEGEFIWFNIFAYSDAECCFAKESAIGVATFSQSGSQFARSKI